MSQTHSVRETSQAQAAHTLPLVVSGTFTAEPVRETLEFWDSRFGWGLEIGFAPYNQTIQGLLDPGSAMGRNRGINVLLIRWTDLLAGAGGSDAGPAAVDELAAALRASAGRSGTPHLVVIAKSSGRAAEDLDWHALDSMLADRVADAAAVHVLRSDRTDRLYPVASWQDEVAEAAGRVPYTSEYFSALGTVTARGIRALQSRPHKVIVLDCDNTLWGGACGELGSAGVVVDEPFRRLQELVVQQAAAGRLICLCSKNTEADVRAVFADRSDMPLRWETIAAYRVNWDPKPDNLRALAGELNVGLDSFVFLDDSPVECAAVLAELPQVLTLQLPSQEQRIPDFLDHVWAFDALQLTDEDRRRGAMYMANAQREKIRRGATSLSEFLESLDLRIDIQPVAEADVTRAVQLTQRTNQFNMRPEPRTIADIRAGRQHESGVCHRVTVSDRFGDYGTVGLMIGSRTGDVLDVDTVLLSCRALGRGVEHRMVGFLGEFARASGARSVRLRYRRTDRNEPAQRFLAFLAAREGVVQAADGVIELPAATAAGVRLEPTESIVDSPDVADGRENGSGAERLTTSPELLDLLRQIPLDWSRASDVVAAITRDVRTRPDLQQSYTEPRPGRERRIAGIWRDVLRVDRVGAQDRFTDLGGTSLHVVRVHGRLFDELGVDLDITTLFQHATVRALSEWMDGSHADGVGEARTRAARQRAVLAGARPARSR